MRKLTLIALAVGLTAVLAACGSDTENQLVGRPWQLTAITEKVPAYQGVIAPEDQGKYVITFNADDTYNGTADCNKIAGTYKTSGRNGLTINPGISTLALCPEGSFGDLFVHGLTQAETYEIANEALTITLKDKGTMTFVVGARAGCVGRGDHGADRGSDGGPHGHALTDSQAHADAHREADPNPHRQADGGADGHGDGRADDRTDDRAHRQADACPDAEAHAQADSCPDPGADPDARRGPHRHSVAADGRDPQGPGLPGRRAARPAGQLHDQLRDGRDVLGQGRLQHRQRRLHRHVVGWPDALPRPDDHGRVRRGLLLGPVHHRPDQRPELRRGQQPAHDHAGRRGNAPVPEQRLLSFA